MKKFLDYVKKNRLFISVIVIAIAVLITAFVSGGAIKNNNQKAELGLTEPSSSSASQTSYPTSIEETSDQSDVAETNEETTNVNSKTENTTSERQSVTSAEHYAAEEQVKSNNQSTNVNVDTSNTYIPNKQSASSSGFQNSVTQPVTQDKYLTDPVPAGKPKPVEPQEQEIKDESLSCTFSISCATILDNMDSLKKGKEKLVPKDGIILKPTKVTFNEGETVFDVLQQVCKDNKIHMEFSWTPIYNSAYIEGINNLYEFDCTSGSGWMYKVNNWFPNYGCSRYQLKNGDIVEWLYTCDYGYDIGGGYITEE